MARRIVVSLITAEQEFQLFQADDARKTAARLGLEVEVLFAENNAVLQIQQLFRFVHLPEPERPAAIVVETITGEGLERVARNATASGIGWLLLNRHVAYLEPLRRERPQLPVAMVGTDQEEMGRIQARQFRALLPKGGNILYVQGPPDTSVARERLRGAEGGIAGAPIHMRVLNGDWTEESGEKALSSWLRLKTSEGFQVDIVGCQNDSMAIGARRAVGQARPAWAAAVRYTGCDGLPNGGRRLVDEGVLAATVVSPSNTGPALERIAAWLRSGELPPRDVLLEPHSHPAEAFIRP
jgi:ABC-type sugar transport system substrate-binding protein